MLPQCAKRVDDAKSWRWKQGQVFSISLLEYMGDLTEATLHLAILAAADTQWTDGQEIFAGKSSKGNPSIEIQR